MSFVEAKCRVEEEVGVGFPVGLVSMAKVGISWIEFYCW